MGSSVIWQLEFWHRALSAYGILSIGILAYGILSILLLAYSILAMHLGWHSQIIITAGTSNWVNKYSFGNNVHLLMPISSQFEPKWYDSSFF